MTMAQYAERAGSLNNEAVSMLLAGNDEMAVARLAQSIALMKRVLARAQAQTAVSSSRSSSTSCCSGSASSLSATGPISPLVEQDLGAYAIIHDASAPLAHLVDRQYYIYNHALTISNNIKEEQNVPLKSYAHVYCAIIMFNMALAHHRRGLQHGNRLTNKKCKDRAIVLYNLILRLLRQSDTTTTAALVEGSAGFIKLATLNNLSQLRFEQGQYAQAREGLDYLGSLIQRAQLAAGAAASASTEASSNNNQAALFLESIEMKGLILNVLFVKSPQCASAA
jgi:hypothetical protein